MADIIINPNIDKENRLNQIFEFIKDRQFYCAVAYAKVCKRREEAYNKLNNTKDDYFDKLYTALAYAFDDPWYGVKAYDNFNFKDKKVENKDFSSFDETFFDFLFLSIVLRILYSNETPNFPNEKDIDEINSKLIEFEDDIKLENIFTFLYKFKKDNNIPFSFLADKAIKKTIGDRKSNNKDIKEISLEQEIKKYISNNKDVDFNVRNKIFNLNSDLYALLQTAIDENDYEYLLSDEIDNIEFYKIVNNNELKINIGNIQKYVESKSKIFSKKFKNENGDKFRNICQDVEKLLDFVYCYLKNISDEKSEEKANTEIDIYIKAYNEIYSELESVIDNIKIFISKKKREEQENGYIAGLSTLLYTFYNIKDCLSLDYEKEKYTYQYGKYFYVPFLLSDDVIVNVNFIPDFPNFYFEDNFLPSINCDEERNKKFFESIIPEGIIIEHAQKFKNLDYSFYNLKSKLENRPDDDNYTTKRVISKYLNKKEIFSEDDINDAKKDSKFDCKDFDGKLELAEVCCQLEDVNILKESSDKARENAFEIYVNFRENIDENFYKWLCEDNENFTYFKKVVDIYSQYINDNSDILADYYLNDKIQKKYKEDTDEFKNISAFLKKYKNYSAVREFLDNGKKIFEQDSLLEYLSNYIKKNNRYFRDSKNDVKLNIIIDDELNDDSIDEESRKKLLNIAKNWEDIFSTIKRTSEIDTKKLRELLYYLGFEVEENGINDKVDDEFIIDAYNNTQYLKTCEITVSDNNNISLNHQLATFIPYIFKNGFRIVFIDENLVLKNKVKDLIKFSDRDEISNKHTIIFYNYRLDLNNDRRQLSDAIKTMRADNNNLFLFIDRVVILFLLENFSYCLKIAEEKAKEEQKMVDVREILNDLLMSIILPFGFYQPYESMTSAEKTGDKANKDTANKEIMFVGRKEELETIEKNFKGPFMIVYGGRQLGKSLFLKQAGKNINRDKNSIAIYIDLKTETEYDKVLQNIVVELEKKNIVNSKNIENWDQFQSEVNKFLDDPKNEKKKIYLLLDEVDGFITSCKNHIEIISGKEEKGTDKPFKIIKSIFDTHSGRFNVVLAGLNLYIDFKKGFFTENNRIAGQFSKDSDDNFIHIKPFEIEDAVELIERPLHYLGLDFSEDLSLVYLILYNTNYYPCLIQMYCKKMLENMNKNYSLYSGPIYKIAKKHIQEILIEEQFQEDVKDTFELTLKLNSKGGNEEDYTFKYLANILALLCYKFGYKSYSLADFQNLAKGSDKQVGRIEKICNLNDKDLSNLLDLLEKLSVFEKIDGKYRFKRFSLFKLMGKTEDDIRKNLKDCLEKDLYKE